jgi:phage FluMu protein Com
MSGLIHRCPKCNRLLADVGVSHCGHKPCQAGWVNCITCKLTIHPATGHYFEMGGRAFR